ncbi:hypothetical protein CYMTET_31705, partial [Cymbomonas tetramitiformis]
MSLPSPPPPGIATWIFVGDLVVTAVFLGYLLNRAVERNGRGFALGFGQKPNKIEQIVKATAPLLDCPLTVKIRMGYYNNKLNAHEIIPKLKSWGAAACTLHGRTREQRYTKLANWDYIGQCATACQESDLPLIGNGDIFSFPEWKTKVEASGVATSMIARGALIKPWIFTEIKERRDWDISGSERLELLKQYCSYGLEHWGTDTKGVETTRRFMLEWMSFLHRYIPHGLL